MGSLQSTRPKLIFLNVLRFWQSWSTVALEGTKNKVPVCWVTSCRTRHDWFDLTWSQYLRYDFSIDIGLTKLTQFFFFFFRPSLLNNCSIFLSPPCFYFLCTLLMFPAQKTAELQVLNFSKISRHSQHMVKVLATNRNVTGPPASIRSKDFYGMMFNRSSYIKQHFRATVDPFIKWLLYVTREPADIPICFETCWLIYVW